MNLQRLLNEIDLLYRSGIDARDTIAALIIDYFNSLGVPEPPMPVYGSYSWPEGVVTFE